MQLRHEVKLEISQTDMLLLRQRLRAVLRPDSHAKNGRYTIRSLYFDTPDDRALREKLDGALVREKYRIRMYDHDTRVIHLERKYKRGALGCKTAADLTRAQAQSIIDGDVSWLAQSSDAFLREFYAQVQSARLRPAVIVDYTREPFVHHAGNVRVTLDYDIRTGLRSTDFFSASCPTIPIPDAPCVLEVKWDGFLPEVVRGAIQLDSRHAAAFSKYAACRMYE